MQNCVIGEVHRIRVPVQIAGKHIIFVVQPIRRPLGIIRRAEDFFNSCRVIKDPENGIFVWPFALESFEVVCVQEPGHAQLLDGLGDIAFILCGVNVRS